ncbi:ras association domain-containing protein 8 isoform X1 [Callorhinchus milii]|uniref:ras association domain-containing protein 8 isoform X1 n=1 Tax=Callorhinchus milii TaxID=7868 RepID=UPI001C3FC8FD|nr:ras association domain-containing protein 8 isoform X1 [Callorhinchus milii]XP_007907538.2 ras association domain-containing protein 8 isoform X1 [Callorhinchus milii]XP_007907540.2 ras association domain-containing protein 8 isoform X1 [Callorhinchus milii]
MELKVWVDGVQRVVCGVTEETTCQEVVIALAQAIGQTGRYVLIQRLRDTERQLLAGESPLQLLTKCGQYANDVQFILRRTGASRSERPASDEGSARGPDRTFGRPDLPVALTPTLPGGTQAPKRREPKKSLTFTGGTALGITQLTGRDKWRERKQNGTQERTRGASNKEELFKMILQQKEMLHSVAAQHESVDREITSQEQATVSDFESELVRLERLVRGNEGEIREGEFWENELEMERSREHKLQESLGELRKNLKESVQRLQEVSSRSQDLDRELTQERDTVRRLKAAHRLSLTGTKEASARIRAEIEAKEQETLQIQASIIEVERALEQAVMSSQGRTQELEELNKELRQCNLQQFIQQTGTSAAVFQWKPEDEEQLSNFAHQLPPSHRNGDIHISDPDSPPRPTTKQFLGNPRNLQNPLVSSLTPGEFHHWRE